MLKKITLAFAVAAIMALTSAAAFAQLANVELTDADIKTFLTVYADPSPTAVATASASVSDPVRFASVAGKITGIYQMKQAGADDAAIKAAFANSPMEVSDADLAAYAPNADEIKDKLDKMMAAATSMAQ
ncbi:MAG: hypothetical protein LBJ64_08295 [Deltaproteobacteria bacterium]|jgi:hypothetical protein|nr:hypothetical protein [Deltaproteobacteria bacterium]